MITIELKGGLGNQLFQIATAYTVALENNCNLVLQVSYFDTNLLRKLEISYFTFPFTIINKKK